MYLKIEKLHQKNKITKLTYVIIISIKYIFNKKIYLYLYLFLNIWKKFKIKKNLFKNFKLKIVHKKNYITVT